MQEQHRQVAAAIQRLRKLSLGECFDPVDQKSRPTVAQDMFLHDLGKVQHRYIRAGNQGGKSQTISREYAWLFSNTHPFWVRPTDWGEEPLLMIVLGRDRRQIEDVLWAKIRSFLPEGSYKEVRTGMMITKVVHLETGNTIVFIPHSNANEARQNAQAYVAHAVWIDEMPTSVKLIEELHRRVQARRGYFVASFTPKVVNIDIQRLVDSVSLPLGKVYRFKMFDNPIYTDEDKQRILDSMKTYSEAYRRTLLEGEWMTGEEMVYSFNAETMMLAPTEYSPGWRHIISVDPALKSKLGLCVAAEDPRTGKWYLVRADYLTNIFSPADMVEAVEKIASQYNIIRRISDPHEVWFITTASQKGFTYLGVHAKANRKGELIKNLQMALGSTLFVTSWCSDLIAEITTCRWSETSEGKIVNGSSFHLLDALQYLVDMRPKWDQEHQLPSWTARLNAADNKRRTKEEAIRSSKKTPLGPRIRVKRKLWSIAR